MHVDFKVASEKLIELSFRDEATVYTKLRSYHRSNINRGAAIKI